jgi:hypothetical protein
VADVARFAPPGHSTGHAAHAALGEEHVHHVVHITAALHEMHLVLEKVFVSFFRLPFGLAT